MAYYYSLLATIAVYTVVFGLFLSRHHTQSDKLRGKLLILAPIIWAACYTITFSSVSKNTVGFALSADFIKHLMIGSFIYIAYKGASSTPAARKGFLTTLSFGAVILSSLGIANTMLMFGHDTQEVIGFTGIGVAFIQAVLADRLNVAMTENGTPNRPLFLTLITWSIVDFTLSCEIAITGSLTTDQVMWKAITLLVTLTLFWKAVGKLHQRPVKIAMSRPLAFQSTLFSLAGGYLLLMAFAAYMIDYLALDIPFNSRNLLFSLALCPLFALVLSKRLRREIMVSVNKHFFANQFDYRKTWLSLNESLDLSLTGKQAYQRALKSGLDTIEHKSGFLFTVSKSGSTEAVAQIGLEANDKVASSLEALIPLIQEQKWVIDIKDATGDSDEYGWITNDGLSAIEILESENLRWIIPVFRENELTSIWLVGDAHMTSWKLNWETRDFLSAVAHQLDRYMLTLETRQTLSEHAQLAAFHQMSAFVIHDLKNVRAQVDMLITNGEMFKHEPEFIDDMFITMGAMRTRMDKMLGQLTNKNRETKTGSVVNLSEVVREVVQAPDLPDTPTPNIVQLDASCHAHLDGEKLKNVLRHLIDNAQHACKNTESPIISVKCLDTGNCVTITIADNGEGMTPEFIQNRLFKPFETTKGNSGMGLGVYDARVFARSLGGDLTVTSKIREGTRFTMTIQKSKGVDDDNSDR
tara:strand:+ start:6528 stop:8612 length:2085 start_codon:yes stop_codon:yes gene_type:complete